jgi:very-short-patch-repair endonuclease
MPPAFVPTELTKSPFTTAEAARAGVSTSALRGGRWRHVFRNVWVHSEVEDSRETRLAATRLVLGEHAFVCGLTAAWLYGIDARDKRWDRVWVGCPTGRRLRTRPGCYTKEVTVDVTDLDLVNGVLLTIPVRTLYDCARWLRPPERIVVADALAHDGLVTADELSAYRNSHRGIRHVTRVDEVLRMLEPLSESPMESRLRYLLVAAGLPRPTAQHVVRDAAGNFVARLDLAYPGCRLAIEYDGAFHWEQRREDDRRRDGVRARGWTVLVVSGSDLRGRGEAVVERVRGYLPSAVD